MKKFVCTIAFASLMFSACTNHVAQNQTFENALVQAFCSEGLVNDSEAKIKKNDDVIYTGLNAGLITRNCSNFEKSNFFLDSAEESYRWDVDEKGVVSKGAKLVATTLVNDTIVDYDGSLYERIMVNAYKGLNFMSLGDYQNARVEFKRAQIRQDMAKQYFAKQIEEQRKDMDKAKEDPEYKKNYNDNLKTINKEYDNLFKEFHTTRNFINPYATYLASVFYFMDADYRQANNLFREVAISDPKNKELQKQAQIFKSFATKTKAKKAPKYVFVVYEDGFGPIKDEFSLTLPFIVDKNPITTSIALQTLKKREASFGSIIANGTKSSQIANLDDVVATEFKITMPGMIAKALTSTIIKTAINAAVASEADNDSTGALLSIGVSLLNSYTTKADVRSWRGLPKTISALMLENKGSIKITDPKGGTLFEQELSKNKNALIIVRSFSPNLPSKVFVIEK